jgi:small GTP-binding protein
MKTPASPSPGKKMTVVVIGGHSVGKTSIINAYMSGRALGPDGPTPPQTVQLAFSQKDEVIGDRVVHLHIRDTAGHERFQFVCPNFYRDAHGALVVFDVTNLQSFQKIHDWINEFSAIMPDTFIQILIGNKIDLEKQRLVTREQALSYAHLNDISYVETSAVTGHGVQNAFQMLTEKFLEQDVLKTMFVPVGIDLAEPTKQEKPCC